MGASLRHSLASAIKLRRVSDTLLKDETHLDVRLDDRSNDL